MPDSKRRRGQKSETPTSRSTPKSSSTRSHRKRSGKSTSELQSTRSRRRANKSGDTEEPNGVKRNGSLNHPDSRREQRTETATPRPSAPEIFSEEAKNVMREFVSATTKNGVHALRLNYATLKDFQPPFPAKDAFNANLSKCRYKDIPCWDRTRVVLKWPKTTDGDFIHANYVRHELLENYFICTQGPMENTVIDFWRMCWQERVKQIIMLCCCEELGKQKCSQYWPQKVGESRTIGPLVVRCEKLDHNGEESRHLDHRQWTTWPDKSVPKTPMAPFRLLQHTRRQTKYPSVIHCSAGVGRSGTLVAIEVGFRSLIRAQQPNMIQLIKDLRAQRSHIVQTEDQYIYVHYALLQLMLTKKVIEANGIRGFCKEYEQYLKLLNEHGGKHLPLASTAVLIPALPANPIVQPSLEKQKKSPVEDPRPSRLPTREVVIEPFVLPQPVVQQPIDQPAAQPIVPVIQPAVVPMPTNPILQEKTAENPPNEQPPLPIIAPSEAAEQAIQPPSDPAVHQQLSPVACTDAISADPLTTPQQPSLATKPTIQYKPPATYTVKMAGSGKKIIYHRPTGPYVKTMANGQAAANSPAQTNGPTNPTNSGA
ncbi:hypothetical protein M3Y98_01219600 [Aphelenchoides besseyi]|nr:hypothetical protein M3Y98_01219600 [Aphelenchoides besseyi]KAI6193324.1 hypothetical protein M3Y96_01006000 [Aphelenchoides besseyi]